MISYSHGILRSAETMAQTMPVDVVLRELRKLPLADFGELMLKMPLAEWPALSKLLPAMASDETQKNWTGSSGFVLLRQSLSFCLHAELNYLRYTGNHLAGQKLLDFGCGYGRILRLMYWYSSPALIYGVDPWDESIRLCLEKNILGNLSISDYLPQSLPVGDAKFDFIYAFSVFTHTSERAARTALKALRHYVEDDGLAVITFRPREYWTDLQHHNPHLPHLLEKHDTYGYAFLPHVRAPVDGDITYGDTSFTLDWFNRTIDDWSIAGIDRSLEDPYQVQLYLYPR